MTHRYPASFIAKMEITFGSFYPSETDIKLYARTAVYIITVTKTIPYKQCYSPSILYATFGRSGMGQKFRYDIFCYCALEGKRIYSEYSISENEGSKLCYTLVYYRTK